MKLHLHQAEHNQINGCSGDNIIVNHQPYAASVIVSASTVHSHWFEQRWEALDATALSAVLAMQPEVVLLGTGDKHRFIHPKHIQDFLSANIAVECMSTAAACRTYNILSNEGRKVVAALLLETTLAGNASMP